MSVGDFTASCLIAMSYSIHWGSRITLQNNVRAHLLIHASTGRRPRNASAAELAVLVGNPCNCLTHLT